MPGLLWTHVWNRRSEDTVTYRGLKNWSTSHMVLEGKLQNMQQLRKILSFLFLKIEKEDLGHWRIGGYTFV